MKNIALAAAVLAFSSATAFAADLGARPYAKAPTMESAYNWSGLYIGGQFGASSAQTRFSDYDDFFDNQGLNPDRSTRFTGGAYGGYNWQFGSFLVGLDAQWSWYDLKSTSAPDGFNNPLSFMTTSIRDAGSVKARLGLAFTDTMVYVGAGPAWANMHLETFDGVDRATADKYVSGWAAAVGVEHMITPSWLVRGQFQYAAYDTQRAFSPTGQYTVGQSSDVMEAIIGISYKFGSTY